MRRFILRRLLHGVAVIFIATTLSFFLVHLAPGDPFSSSLESLATDPRVLAARRAAYGLDRPLAEQYVRFLTRLVTGDLGPSILAAGPAEDALAAAIPNTLVLMGTALALGLIAGVALGAWQAMRVGSRADRAVDTASLVVASLPEFWLGLLLLLLLAGKFRLFPTGGATDYMHDLMSPGERIVDRLRHLALPALTLALLSAASIARYQRAALLDVLPQNYVRTARAKGVGERQLVWRHALRNALVPTIVLVGLSLPALLGGAVFVERVFAWPGMGRLAADAYDARDYPIVLGATLVGTALVTIGGIATDVLHAIVDPRVRSR